MTKNNPCATVEIRCKTPDEAVDLANRIIKSGVLTEEQQVKVYEQVYFCD